MPITFKGRVPLREAMAIAMDLKLFLLQAGFKKVEICGSVRRLKETVGDLDLVVDGDLQIMKDLSGDPRWQWTWKEGGASKATVEFRGMQVNLLHSDQEHWGAAIFYFTGPGQYNIAYRRNAKRRGLLLNERGVFDQNGKCLASRTEVEIYAAFGKHWKAPELRGK